MYIKKHIQELNKYKQKSINIGAFFMAFTRHISKKKI